MNLSVITRRFKLATASALLTCGLVGGHASAAIDAGSLFLLATDESRDGSPEAYILDLNVDIINGDPASFGGITDAGLAAWLNHGDASEMITWGVFGAGILGTAQQFRIASTVNPQDVEPQGLSFSSLTSAIERGNELIEDANGVGAADSLVLAGNDFPEGFGKNWGVNTPFTAIAELGELLPMYIFGVDSGFGELDPLALDGFWNLDPTTGSLEFAPVPVPAAVWMFGTAVAGLFGLRRRRTGS